MRPGRPVYELTLFRKLRQPACPGLNLGYETKHEVLRDMPLQQRPRALWWGSLYQDLLFHGADASS
jgi:hypothetical protein